MVARKPKRRCTPPSPKPRTTPVTWLASTHGVSGYLFGLPHHAKHVLAQDLVNLLPRIAAVEELLRDVGIARHVFELLGHARDPVEVGPQPSVVDAGHLDD